MRVNNSGKDSKRLGRPKKYASESVELKRRNITATDPAWYGLEEVYKENNLSSKSDLFEQVGRKNLRVVSQNRLLDIINAEEIPVLQRLFSLTEKTPYMRSIISFARIVLLRIGVYKEINYVHDELIERVILEALSLVALRDYVYPDHLVMSAVADIRWLVFRLLVTEFKIDFSHIKTDKSIIESAFQQINSSSETSAQISEENITLCAPIDKIFDSIYYFAISFPSQYQIFKMRMMEGLTWEQISRILKIRGIHLTKEQIRVENHKAVDEIRNAWHSFEKRKGDSQENKENLKKEMEKALLLAQKYYDLINVPGKFSSEQFQKWEAFLLISMDRQKLDLLLPEIHHSWVHQQDQEYIDKEEYKNRSTCIMENINREFKELLSKKLDVLKQKLKFCGNKAQNIHDTFTDVEIFPLGIPANVFLGARIKNDQF